MFNWWTFLFQALNFVVLAYVLHRLLYRPLHDAIDRRRQATAKAQADAEAAREEAEALQRKLAAQLAELEQKRQDVIHEAAVQAEAERQKVLAFAEQALEQRREESRQALKQERDEALEALRSEVIAQAVALARRLLGEAADRTLHQQLSRRLSDTLSGLAEADRQRLRAQLQPGEGVVLETAEEPDAGTLQELTDAVSAVAGRRLAVSVQVRPALLGGARLRLAGQVWDSSLAAQLPCGGAT